MTGVRLICEADKATKENNKMKPGIPDNIFNDLHSKFQRETGAQLESAKRLDSVVSEVALLREEFKKAQPTKWYQRTIFLATVIAALAGSVAAWPVLPASFRVACVRFICTP